MTKKLIKLSTLQVEFDLKEAFAELNAKICL
jgi:hypothetical protein